MLCESVSLTQGDTVVGEGHGARTTGRFNKQEVNDIGPLAVLIPPQTTGRSVETSKHRAPT